MSGWAFGRKAAAMIAACCLLVACLGLAACGGNASGSSASEAASSSEGASTSSASTSSVSASGSAASSVSASSASAAADPETKFVGSWIFAAAESQGVTMSGNFGAMFDMADSGMLTINADGTGTMNFGGKTAEFSWAASGDDAIDVTVTSDTELTIMQATPVTYKDDALFMDIEQDGQAATAIFTEDGVYAGAKDFAISDAKPITSEAELLGTWELVGMKMVGIAIYGTTESLSSMNGGVDQSLTFEAGGTVKIGDSMQGTWTMDANGTTVTSEDITGEHTYPVLMLDGMLVADMSEIMQGQEFATVYEKNSSTSVAATSSSAAAETAEMASRGSDSILNIDGVDVKDISFDMVGDTPNFMIVFSNTTDKDVEVDLSKFKAMVDDKDEVNFHLTKKTISANTPYSQNAFTASANTMKVGDKVTLYYDGEPVGTYEVTEF